MRAGRWVPALGAVLLVGACARPNHQAAAMAAIAAADSAFAKATAERGVDGWVSFFAHDGVMVTPGRNIVGRAAIREAMAASLGDTTRSLTWHPVSAEASQEGDLGYTIGRWDRTVRSGADTAVTHGSYVTLWRKQGDGTWKAVLDIGNADPAR